MLLTALTVGTQPRENHLPLLLLVSLAEPYPHKCQVDLEVQFGAMGWRLFNISPPRRISHMVVFRKVPELFNYVLKMPRDGVLPG